MATDIRSRITLDNKEFIFSITECNTATQNLSATAQKNFGGAGAAADEASSKFTKLAKVAGKIGGAGRYEFMFINGLTQAIEEAQGSWSKFSGALAATGLYTGAALGIAAIISKAKSMAAEADEAWKAAGVKAQGFFGNLAIGFGVKEIPKISGVIDISVIGATKAERDLKRLKDYLKEINDQVSPEQAGEKAVRETDAKYASEMSALAPKMVATQGIFDALNTAENLPDTMSLKAAAIKAHQAAFPNETNPQFFSKTGAGDLLSQARAESERQRAANSAEYQRIQQNKNAGLDAGKAAASDQAYDNKRREAALARMRGTPDAALENALVESRTQGISVGSQEWESLLAAQQGIQKENEANAKKAEADDEKRRRDKIAAYDKQFDALAKSYEEQAQAEEKLQEAQREGFMASLDAAGKIEELEWARLEIADKLKDTTDETARLKLQAESQSLANQQQALRLQLQTKNAADQQQMNDMRGGIEYGLGASGSTNPLTQLARQYRQEDRARRKGQRKIAAMKTGRGSYNDPFMRQAFQDLTGYEASTDPSGKTAGAKITNTVEGMQAIVNRLSQTLDVRIVGGGAPALAQ